MTETFICDSCKMATHVAEKTSWHNGSRRDVLCVACFQMRWDHLMQNMRASGSEEEDQVMDDSPVLTYARLLRENHALIAQGKGDSPEAEALAEQMDSPWHALNAQEQQQMRKLSAALQEREVMDEFICEVCKLRTPMEQNVVTIDPVTMRALTGMRCKACDEAMVEKQQRALDAASELIREDTSSCLTDEMRDIHLGFYGNWPEHLSPTSTHFACSMCRGLTPLCFKTHWWSQEVCMDCYNKQCAFAMQPPVYLEGGGDFTAHQTEHKSEAANILLSKLHPVAGDVIVLSHPRCETAEDHRNYESLGSLCHKLTGCPVVVLPEGLNVDLLPDYLRRHGYRVEKE